MRIATQIALLVIVCVSLALFVAGGLFTGVLHESVVEQEKSNLVHQVHFRLGTFELQSQALKADAALLARTHLSYQFLSSEGDVQLQRLTRSLLTETLKANAEYVQVRLLDHLGHEALRVERLNGSQIVNIPQAQLQDKSTRPYFRNTAALTFGEVYLSPIDLNREHGEISEPKQAMLRAASPIFHNGKFFGVAVINRKMDRFLHNIAAHKQLQSVYLINPSGYFLVHDNPEYTFGFEFNGQYHVDTLNPEFQAFWQDLPANSHLHLSLGHAEHYEFESHGNLLVAARYIYNQGADDYFTLVISTPIGWLEYEKEALVQRFFWVFLILLALFTGVAVYGSRRLGSGITSLRAMLRGIASGEREPVLPVLHSVELAELARNIQQMSAEIQNQEASLRDTLAIQNAMLEALPCGVVVIDEEGTIMLCNEWICDQFGYQRTELVDQNVKVLMPERDARTHDRFLEEYVVQGHSHIVGRERTLFALHRNGDTFPVRLVVATGEFNHKRIFVASVELHEPSATSS